MNQKETMSRYEDGGNSDEKSGKAVPVKVKVKASTQKMGGVKDPLRGALGSSKKMKVHGEPFNHGKTSAPRGAHYNPMGEFGTPHGPMTPATSMTLHFNNPGQNALGQVMNTVGQNALRGGRPLPKGNFRGQP